MIINKESVFASVYNRLVNVVQCGSDDAVLANAKRILSQRLEQNGMSALEDINYVKEYLTVWFANATTEKTCCLYLDQEHRLIHCQNMFFGSINACHRHTQEILRVALLANASGVILSSNVSALPASDTSYMQSLNRMQEALDLIHIRVIDHVFICGTESLSLKEENLL